MGKELMHPNPSTPDQDPTPIVPMVFEEQEYHLEYKHIRQNLDDEEPIGEDKLNELGKDGWELVSVFFKDPFAHYYFKKLVS